MNKITERVGTLYIDNFIKNKLYIKYIDITKGYTK